MRFPRILCSTLAISSWVTCGVLAATGGGTATPTGSSPEIADAHKLMGMAKYTEAKQELEEVVRADKVRRGEQDPQTLAERLDLAVAQSKTGEGIIAEKEMRELLDIFTRRCGPDQSQTMECRMALARLLDDAGRPHEAADEYRGVLEVQERMLGSDDIEVARVESALGSALSDAQKFGEGIEQFEKAEPIFEKVLGAEHPETLLNRSNIAMAEGENHQFDIAEKELEEILSIRERLLGPNDIAVLTTCFELGRILGGHKRYEEALSYATRAEEGLRIATGPSTHATVLADQLCTEIRTDLNRTQAAKDGASPDGAK